MDKNKTSSEDSEKSNNDKSDENRNGDTIEGNKPPDGPLMVAMQPENENFASSTDADEKRNIKNLTKKQLEENIEDVESEQVIENEEPIERPLMVAMQPDDGSVTSETTIKTTASTSIKQESNYKQQDDFESSLQGK